MKIEINGKSTKFDFVYPTSYEGSVYLWGSEGSDCITITAAEWQYINEIMTTIGWLNDGSAVA